MENFLVKKRNREQHLNISHYLGRRIGLMIVSTHVTIDPCVDIPMS